MKLSFWRWFLWLGNERARPPPGLMYEKPLIGFRGHLPPPSPSSLLSCSFYPAPDRRRPLLIPPRIAVVPTASGRLTELENPGRAGRKLADYRRDTFAPASSGHHFLARSWRLCSVGRERAVVGVVRSRWRTSGAPRPAPPGADLWTRTEGILRVAPKGQGSKRRSLADQRRSIYPRCKGRYED